MRIGLAVVGVEPADGVPEVVEVAAGEPDLANHGSLLRREQAPEQFALVQRGEGGGVPRVVEQLDQAGGRIEHGGSRPADGEATAGNGRRGYGSCLEDQPGDGRWVEVEHQDEERLGRPRARDRPGDRQPDGRHEVIAGAVAELAVGEDRAFCSLDHERQRGLDHVADRLAGRRRSDEADVRYGGRRHAVAGMTGDERPQPEQRIHTTRKPQPRAITP